MHKEINPFLKHFFPLVDCIADLFGQNCEVVLHDISNLEHSIIKIRNGHVTGREVGNSMTDVGLEMIKEAENGLTLLGNYNPKLKTGKLLKSNAVNIRNLKGKHIGILCINIDITELIQLDHKIRDFYLVGDEQKGKATEEHFEENILSIIQKVIDMSMAEKSHLIHNLTKKDRLEIIEMLDKKGIFLVKGAMLQLSKSLGLSPPTIYKYLEEIRFMQKENRILAREHTNNERK